MLSLKLDSLLLLLVRWSVTINPIVRSLFVTTWTCTINLYTEMSYILVCKLNCLSHINTSNIVLYLRVHLEHSPYGEAQQCYVSALGQKHCIIKNSVAYIINWTDKV